MLVDEGLQLLTEDQARALLATGDIGRVGVVIGTVPAIFPVNYRIIDDAIVFRTAARAKLSAAATGSVMAFEVDTYDTATKTGWSVLAVGASEVVHDLDLAFAVLQAGLEPSARGRRAALVRCKPAFVSGRRIIPDAPDG